MKINTPSPRTGQRRWYCGPFALAAITGLSFEDARSAINRIRGWHESQGITGVSRTEMMRALASTGLGVHRIFDDAAYKASKTLAPTFNAWLKTLAKDDDGLYLVDVTRHWVVVKGRQQLIDNHTAHPVAAFAAPWQRKRVVAAYRIS